MKEREARDSLSLGHNFGCVVFGLFTFDIFAYENFPLSGRCVP